MSIQGLSNELLGNIFPFVSDKQNLPTVSKQWYWVFNHPELWKQIARQIGLLELKADIDTKKQVHDFIFLREASLGKIQERHILGASSAILRHLKDTYPDIFSSFFISSLHNKQTVELFVRLLTVEELEAECKKTENKITFLFSTGEELILNKQLLCHYFPIYQTAFSGPYNDKKADKIELPEFIDYNQFKAVIDFLFSDFGFFSQVNEENIEDLFVLANYFQFKSVIKGLENWILANFEEIDTVELISLDKQFGLSPAFIKRLQDRSNEEATDVFREHPIVEKSYTISKRLQQLAPYVTKLELPSCTKNFNFLSSFCNLRKLKLEWWKAALTDHAFATMPVLGSLTTLDLAGTSITNESIPILERFPKLRCLDIRASHVRGLEQLEPFKSIETIKLYLQDGCITNEELVHLSKLDLKKLIISGKLNQTGVELLKNLVSLKYLDLNRVDVARLDLWPLGNLTQLESLDLSHTKINDMQLERFIPRLQNMSSLYLTSTKITDKIIPTIQLLRNLRSLGLSRCAINKQGLAGIIEMESLEEVDLSYTKIGQDQDKDNKLFKAKWKNLKSIKLNNTKISSADLEILAACQDIKSVDLRGCPNIDFSGYHLIPHNREVLITDLAPINNPIRK